MHGLSQVGDCARAWRCLDCPRGYTNGGGSSTCPDQVVAPKKCDAGSFLRKTTKECELCSGMFAKDAGSSECKLVRLASTLLKAGRQNARSEEGMRRGPSDYTPTKCLSCGKGKYARSSDAARCETCPHGWVQPHDVAKEYVQAVYFARVLSRQHPRMCQTVPSGNAFRSIRKFMQNCPNGYFTDAVGRSSCKTCPDGFFADAGTIVVQNLSRGFLCGSRGTIVVQNLSRDLLQVRGERGLFKL